MNNFQILEKSRKKKKNQMLPSQKYSLPIAVNCRQFKRENVLTPGKQNK